MTGSYRTYMFGSLIDELVEALRFLPGVGPKSAQRMALHILDKDREGARTLAASIDRALNDARRCQSCRMFSGLDICEVCVDPRRDAGQVCVLETPADLFAIEQSGSYRGRYFVLFGHLSPIDGVGPEHLGIDRLIEKMAGGEIRELILATNLTVEGETTAHFIGEHARAHGINVSRIARGVPLGGELEFVDGSTLAHALNRRTQY